MYSNHHGTLGAGIVLATYLASGDVAAAALIGGALAVVSHGLLDLIGERGYGDMRTTLIWEGVPFAAFLGILWLAGPLWWLLALGWLAGNLFDIIDKKAYLAMLAPRRFRATRWLHRWAVLHQLNLAQTRTSTIAATAVLGVAVWAVAAQHGGWV